MEKEIQMLLMPSHGGADAFELVGIFILSHQPK